jgi:hypothetical protein
MKANPLILLAAALACGSTRAQNVLPADDFPNLPPGFLLPILADGTGAINGRINFSTDTDAFGIQVGLNAVLTVYTTGTTDTRGVLRRQTSAGWVDVVAEEGGTGNFRISRPLDPGLYAIVVSGKLSTNSGAGDYGLKVEITPATPPPANVPDIAIPEVPQGGQLAFGPVPLNTTASRAFTLRNTGLANLEISGVTISSANTAGAVTTGPFMIDGSGARTIAPGGSAQVLLIFKPLTAGAFTAQVRAASNDPDENPYIFTVTGSGQSTAPPPAGEIGMTLGNADIASGGTVDFGTLALPSTAPAVRELIISNSGESDLQIGAIQINPLPTASPLPAPPAGFFRVLTPPSLLVAPGRSTVLRLGAGGNVIVPPGRYTMEATVQNSDSDENPCRLLLTAEIKEAPSPEPAKIEVASGGAAMADDGTLDFGSTPTGTPLTRSVTVRNAGTGELKLTGITVEWAGPIIAIWPPPPLPFMLQGAEPRSVAPGASTEFRVIFPATTPGSAEALLNILNNDSGGNPFTITLKASASGDPVPPPAPEIAVSLQDADLPQNSAVDFGRTSLRVQVKRTLTLSNQGTAPLIVRPAIQPVGRLRTATPLFFRFASPPASTIAPGATIPLDIVFLPLANGTFEALLNISSNDRDENPYRLKLTGKGGTDTTAVPDIALALGDAPLPVNGLLDFGTMVPGRTVTKEIKINNTGTGDLRLGRILISRPPEAAPAAAGVVVNAPLTALPFRALPPPGGIVPAGGSAILRVVYAAPAFGSHAAGLTIESNDPDESPWPVNLKGASSGQAPAPPEISVNSGEDDLPIGGVLDFGEVAMGQSSRKEIMVSNSGTGDMRIAGFSVLPAALTANDALVSIPAAAQVRVVSGPAVIAPGASSLFVLEFLSFAPGAAAFNARISSNDADENPYSFSIKGTVTGGIVPPPVVDPAVVTP